MQSPFIHLWTPKAPNDSARSPHHQPTSMPTKYSMASSRWRRIFRTYRNPLFIVVILFLIVNHFYFLQPETQPPQITPSGIYGLKGFKSPLGHVQHEFGPEDKQTAEIRESRRNAVRGAFLHAWNGYRTYALGHDEVRPMTNLSKDPFGGWGATLVDALSTMLVMELQEEYNDARDAVVAIDFTTTINNVEISVFETIIRYLGGFISAYELSGDELMLRKAEELGKVLIPAFNTHSGLPWSHWNITAQRHNISHSGYYARPPGAPRGHSGISNSAEISTLQLEFIRLSEHTGDPFYGEKARNITDMLYAMGYNEGVNIPGLYPTAIDLQDGIFIGASFGGTGDSMFEYFLKEHILVEGAVPQYAQMYIEAVEGMKDYMLFQETQNGKDYIFIAQVDTRGKTPINQMDHL
ncbi:glycoside hydrolase, partial [Jimgerdemannia flammicorona]